MRLALDSQVLARFQSSGEAKENGGGNEIKIINNQIPSPPQK